MTASITGSSGTIAVSAGVATRFVVSAPGTATAWTPFDFTVTALDANANVATGYTGTVTFSSSDPGAAALPPDTTLTNGAGTFSATLVTVGNQTVTATDTVSSSIAGTSSTIAVSAASAPTVTAVDASIGSTDGGDTVDVVGMNLSGATTVDFGPIAATSFTVDSPTQLTAVTPAHTAGTVDVKVTTAGGTSLTSRADRYSYQSVSPTAYVANFGDNTVTPIDTATKTTGSPITVGGIPSPSPSPLTGPPPTSPT